MTLLKSLGVAFASVIAATASLSAQSDYEKVYIIAADADGKLVFTGDTYRGMTELTAESIDNEHHYRASGVTLDYPYFAIYTYNPSSGQDDGGTFMQLYSYAVRPIPLNYPSPLMIGMESTAVISLHSPGTYDFDFYGRDIDGINTNMIKVSSADESAPQYPDQVYIVDSANKTTAIPGDPATGYYEGDVAVPSAFRLSYEPRYSIDAFIFGPVGTDGTALTGAVTLQQGIRQPVAYGLGTRATFNVAPEAKSTSGTSHIYVNLAKGYVLASYHKLSGVEDISADIPPTPAYFTIAGTPLAGKPTAPGLYIERTDKARKVLIK